MADLKTQYDVVIVGAGPAGMTAAIYLRRANMSVLMIDKEVPGGKIVTTATVENYPGFTKIDGPALAWNMFSQTRDNEADFTMGDVVNIAQQPNHWWEVQLADGKTYAAKAVIVATGMKNRKLDIPNQARLENHGVSYCAICDGAIYKGKPVAVVGSGRSAVEESLYLSDIVSEVYLISNKPTFRAEEKDVEMLKTRPNIHPIMETNTLSYNGETKLESLTLEDQTNGKRYDLPVAATFVFIGFLPIAPNVNGVSMLSPTNRFIDVDAEMRTAWEGIYAAGDITTKRIRQISTAINDGAVAAMSVHDYVNKLTW